MTEYERLKKQLRKNQYLIADVDGNVELIGKAQALDAMVNDSGDSILIQNLSKALEQFAQLDGIGKDDKYFSRDEISRIMGVSAQMVLNLRHTNVLRPSVKESTMTGPKNGSLYSWTDAFVAGVLGSLKRHGLKRDVLSVIQPLLSDSNKKRTPQEAATS